MSFPSRQQAPMPGPGDFPADVALAGGQAPRGDEGPVAGGDRQPSLARRLLYRYRLTVISIVSVIIVLAAWQACADLNITNPQLQSSPRAVVSAFGLLVSNGTLGSALAVSGKLFGVGLGVAIILGVVGGILIGWWTILGAIFEPFVAMLYAMPVVALLPIILVWFGITFEAQVVMVVLIAVFPTLVSTIAGTKQVDPQLLRLAKSLRASQLQVMRTIVLPSLVPYVVAGIRLSVGGALIGVVVAEYFLGQAGIGGLIVQAGEVLKTDQVFVGVFILALSSVFISSLLKAAERRLTRWR